MSHQPRYGSDYDSYSPDTGWQRNTFMSRMDPYVSHENHPVTSRSLNDMTMRRSVQERPRDLPTDWPYSNDPHSKGKGEHLGPTSQGTLDGRYRVDKGSGKERPASLATDSDDVIAEDDDTNPNRTFLNILTRFAERTSCVGPSYINSSNHCFTKTLWIVLFLTMTALTIWNVTENCLTYYGWPIKTSVAISYKALPFPTVTVCNTNAVRVTGVALASPDLQEFIGYLDPKTFERPVPTTGQPGRRRRFVDNRQREANFNKTFGPPKLDFGEELGGNASPQFKTQSEFKYLIGLENSTTRYAMGHQMEDMLLSCSFEGRSCESGNFSRFLSEDYGNCYSFNQLDDSGGRVAIRKSYRRGSAYGLQVMMFLEVDEYLPGLTQGYGVRVSVSHPETMAFPSTDGLFVSAGMETDIGIRLLDISRKGLPYANCRGDTEFKKQYGYRYNKQACQAVCPHRSILDTCGCYDGSVERLYPRNTYNHYEACNSAANYECISQVNFQYFAQGGLSCSCPNPCTESVYDTLVSSREWPEDGYMNALIDSVCQSSGGEQTCNNLLRSSEDKQRRNFLKLNVFYRDLNFETLTEEADYPESQFASDLGGSIGLWLGLSVLSMFEVFVLVGEIIVWLGRRCKKFMSKEMKGQKSTDQAGKTANGLDMRNYDNFKRNGYIPSRAL